METKLKVGFLIMIILISISISFIILNSQEAEKQTSNYEDLSLICEKITSKTLKTVCLAMVEKNATKCEEARDSRYVCYDFLASGNRDASLCGNSTSRKSCEAIAERNVAKCGENKDCLIYFAFENKNSNLCKRAVRPIDFHLCEAFVDHDVEKCHLIEGFDRDKCYVKLAILKEDSSICNNINIDETTFDICKSITERNLNYSICKEYDTLCVLRFISEEDILFFEKAWSYDENENLKNSYYVSYVATRVGVRPKDLLLYTIPYNGKMGIR